MNAEDKARQQLNGLMMAQSGINETADPDDYGALTRQIWALQQQIATYSAMATSMIPPVDASTMAAVNTIVTTLGTLVATSAAANVIMTSVTTLMSK